MKIFKTGLLVLFRHRLSFIIYFAVFLGIAAGMASFDGTETQADFTASTPAFSVIDRDGRSAFADGLSAYLETRGTAKELSDNPEELKDALFFHGADVIFVIPEGFSEALFSGEPMELTSYAGTSQADAAYLESLAGQYIAQLCLEHAMYPQLSAEELSEKTVRTLSVSSEVETKRFLESAPVPEWMQIYYRAMPYILMVLTILGSSILFTNFRMPALKMRTDCAPIDRKSLGAQLLLCSLVPSLLFWLLLNLFGIAFCRKDLGQTDVRQIALLLAVSLLFTLCAVSLSLLVSVFIQSANAFHAAANLIALGFGFLGGAFVPLALMDERIQSAAQFTPVYWFEDALNCIVSLTSFKSGALAPIFINMLFLLGFSAVFFCAFLAVDKYKSGTDASASEARTGLRQ